MNSTMTLTLVKYAAGVIVILLIVFLIAVITPKLAGFIDKRRKASDISDSAECIDPKDYTVLDPYEKGDKPEGFDPNYKIYNEDIYGFNRKRKSLKTKSKDNNKES